MDHVISGLLSIVLIDLVLSGDNAIVIGMAVRNLPPKQKRWAMLGGTAGAILLRVTFTVLASLLLNVPFLQAAGGLLLVWITYNLLKPSQVEEGSTDAAGAFLPALWTIVLADLSMSIDNMLAVGAAAHGDIMLLMVGLTLSIAVIMAGGSVVSTLLGKLPWLTYVGGLVLLILAGQMLAEDKIVSEFTGHRWWLQWVFTAIMSALVGLLIWRPWRALTGGQAVPHQTREADTTDAQQ